MRSGKSAAVGTPEFKSVLELRLMALLTDLVREHGMGGINGPSTLAPSNPQRRVIPSTSGRPAKVLLRISSRTPPVDHLTFSSQWRLRATRCK